MTYEEYMQKLNRLVQNRLGMDINDLPDAPFRDYFYEDMSEACLLDTFRTFCEDYWDVPAQIITDIDEW